MARTVKVGLEVDERPYVRGVGRAAEATKRLDAAAGGASGSAKELAAGAGRAAEAVDDVGDAAKGAARGLDSLRDDAARLDRQIDETSRGIRDLARQIASTSDQAGRADLMKKLGGERRQLRQLTNLRSLIDVDSAGAQAASGFAVSFVQRVGPLLARAPLPAGALAPFGVAIGAPIAVGVAATVSAALSGAVVGAAGAGGVIGGLAVAAKHSAVKAEAQSLADTFSDVMQSAGVSFVPATLTALGKVRAEVRSMEGDFERIFGASSRFLGPLTDSALEGARSAIEGIATAVERAGPVMEALGGIAERAGDLIGDTFETLSDHADRSARALSILWLTFEVGIRSLVTTIDALAEVYEWMEKLGAILTFDAPLMAQLATEEERAKAAGVELSPALQELIGGFQEAAGGADTAAAEVETFTDALTRMRDASLGAEYAGIRAEEAFDRLGDVARENAGKGIDRTTAAGRENRKALLDAAKAAKENAAAIFESTGSHDLAAEATERGRAKFLAAAKAMGVEEGQARDLANSIFGIPESAKTKADFEGDNAGVAAWKKTLSGIPREIFTSARLRAIVDIDVRREQATEATGRRWGGVVEHAQWGRLREAQIASPVAPARYAWAEPATGGEAFIPRFGDRDRSLAILSQAAKWYGQQIVPGAAGSGGGVAGVRPEQLARAIRGALVGVAVQMDGRTVGYIQGRQADVLSR